MDTSGDGFIDIKEFERLLTHPQLQLWLHQLEIETTDLVGLFNMLDDGDAWSNKENYENMICLSGFLAIFEASMVNMFFMFDIVYGCVWDKYNMLQVGCKNYCWLETIGFVGSKDSHLTDCHAIGHEGFPLVDCDHTLSRMSKRRTSSTSQSNLFPVALLPRMEKFPWKSLRAEFYASKARHVTGRSGNSLGDPTVLVCHHARPLEVQHFTSFKSISWGRILELKPHFMA